jgi:hypothetical protein
LNFGIEVESIFLLFFVLSELRSKSWRKTSMLEKFIKVYESLIYIWNQWECYTINENT